jgi:hypothetical protein
MKSCVRGEVSAMADFPPKISVWQEGSPSTCLQTARVQGKDLSIHLFVRPVAGRRGWPGGAAAIAELLS